MPVIALQGLRGGMGTTSVTAALAWALQQLGESVLAIDFTPDNLLRLHFNTPFELARGWARAEQDGGGWQEGALRYCENLDFLPFGRLNAAERLEVQRQCQQLPERWRDNLRQLSAGDPQRWILLDVPIGDGALAQQALQLADSVFMLLNPDANCQVRLHQQTLPNDCRFLVNHYSSASQLQQDLHQLWLQTLSGLLPVVIHRDEALAEALAVKQPLGEYRPESLAADEVLTLANWCLINLKRGCCAMSRVLSLLLVPPVRQAVQARYRGYRRNGASALTAFFATLLVALGWMLLRFESPAWQRVRTGRAYWFPHLSAERPRPADALRYLLQGLWLLLFRSGRAPVQRDYFAGWRRLQQRYADWLQGLPQRLKNAGVEQRSVERLGRMNRGMRRALFILVGVLAAILAMLCISQPFDLSAQFVFVVLLWGIAMVVRRVPGRLPALMLIVLSLTVSCRYLWWRYTATLNWDDPLSLVCGLLLLVAETYAWVVLVLGYFQTIWPLNRQPVPLPADSATWPTIDLMVPTYNEDLGVVKPTVYAALGIDWPKEKVNIYILDDGNRPEFRAFAAEVGVKYIARPTHEHAKAGNINNALKQATGEFVAIFDCDHVPTRSFLQLTMGWFFKDKKLAMLQTPHHFFSPDPFERNLGRFRQTPNEGTLFYGLVQDGNDMWDATFFCGSCAILRRSALDEIGGIAVETVTEDAHTSLRLHRRGHTSAYIRIPQAAGLATESLSAHIGQRIRWARGMVQIFRLDNPLLGKGLKLAQRLCYANAMLHFLSGIPRLIFLTAPLAFLLLHAYIIFAPALAIALYVLPHMIHASLTNSRIQGKYRHSFWSEIYETVLAWYIARPTTVALFNPHKGKFNVTAKGGLVEEEHVDWVITRPYMFLVILNLAGLAFGAWRLAYGPTDEVMTVIISLVWVLYNMTILGGAVAVAVEAKQVRQAHRVEIAMPAAIARADGHLYPCTLRDYSDGGVGIEMRVENALKDGDKASLLLKRGQQEYSFPCVVTRAFGNKVGVRLVNLTTREHIDFIQCTFARADTWALWQDGFPEDRPIESLRDVLALGFRGYVRMADYAPPLVRGLLVGVTSLTAWVVSFIPRGVGRDPTLGQQETVG